MGVCEQVDIPYQILVNLNFRDCLADNCKLDLGWK
jgi:hypothetical protein